MVMRITPQQSDRINRLVSKYCANCDEDRNCLLDDGESHRCVQTSAVFGIYCNYFMNVVLPTDRDLLHEIKNQNTN